MADIISKRSNAHWRLLQLDCGLLGRLRVEHVASTMALDGRNELLSRPDIEMRYHQNAIMETNTIRVSQVDALALNQMVNNGGFQSIVCAPVKAYGERRVDMAHTNESSLQSANVTRRWNGDNQVVSKGTIIIIIIAMVFH